MSRISALKASVWSARGRAGVACPRRSSRRPRPRAAPSKARSPTSRAACCPGVDGDRPQHGAPASRARPRPTPPGVYRAPLLPVGTYEVTAALSGFATTRRPNLTLQHRPDPDRGRRAEGGGARRRRSRSRPRRPSSRPRAPHQASTVGARGGRQPARERPQLHRLRAHHARRHPRHARRRHQLRRPARHAQQPGHRRRRQQQHLLRPDPRPHRLRPRALPVQPGRGAGVPGQPQRLLGRVRPRGRRRHQRGHQVGHQRVPRLGLRVLPRQVAQREQLRQQDPRRPIRATRALPHPPVRRLAGRPPPEGQGLLLPLLRRPAPDHPQPGRR